jgi:formylglycine-generating enzyme required for sulfatase activity
MSDRTSMKSILLLAANPNGTVPLGLQKEEREIKERLRLAGYGKTPIHAAGAVRPIDIQQAMLDFDPHIVHFSGHGAGQDGLVFEDAIGQKKLVDSEALAELFELFADQVECVVLNACYSKFQAEAIAQHIDYVIGMSKKIGDNAAIKFSVGFYAALGAGRPFKFAYKLGCNAIRLELERSPEYLTPIIWEKGQLIDIRQNNLTPKTQVLNSRGKDVTPIQEQITADAEDLGNGVTLEMVAIPGGKFQMGSPKSELGRAKDEGPQHTVTLQPFFMGKFPVTQAQWQAVASLPKVNIDLDPDPSEFKGANRPVEQVTWYEAVEFCARLSKATGREYRLPSEAEWEYACRAGTTTPFFFGETISPELANYDGNYTYASGSKGIYREQTTEVGRFPANAFGLYDMHGNVWEWCADHWHENYDGAPTDGSVWLNENENNSPLLRGGSWYHLPERCRSAYRFTPVPVDHDDPYGFRVVGVRG